LQLNRILLIIGLQLHTLNKDYSKDKKSVFAKNKKSWRVVLIEE